MVGRVITRMMPTLQKWNIFIRSYSYNTFPVYFIIYQASLFMYYFPPLWKTSLTLKIINMFGLDCLADSDNNLVISWVRSPPVACNSHSTQEHAALQAKNRCSKEGPRIVEAQGGRPQEEIQVGHEGPTLKQEKNGRGVQRGLLPDGIGKIRGRIVHVPNITPSGKVAEAVKRSTIRLDKSEENIAGVLIPNLNLK